MFPKWLGYFAGRSNGGAVKETRVVPVCGTTELPYRGNYASTTKYTLLSYLPKALFEQYRRVANIFFTLMAALSLTPWSPMRAWTTWTPLLVVVGVSMVKEAQEDYKRHKQDREVNERPARVLDKVTGSFTTVPWRVVRVSDIVEVRRDEFLPADIVLLSSSNPEGNCYVETMNLDGETNLKIKSAPEETKGLSLEELPGLSGVVECEGPNSRLYTFAGNLRLQPPLPPSVAAAVAAAKCKSIAVQRGGGVGTAPASTAASDGVGTSGPSPGGGKSGCGSNMASTKSLDLEGRHFPLKRAGPVVDTIQTDAGCSVSGLGDDYSTVGGVLIAPQVSGTPRSPRSLPPLNVPTLTLLKRLSLSRHFMATATSPGALASKSLGPVSGKGDTWGPRFDTATTPGVVAGSAPGDMRGEAVCDTGGGYETTAAGSGDEGGTVAAATGVAYAWEVVVPLSAPALLLRGCSLRNTEYVHGVVVYAGHDTKIFMNSSQPPSKRSRVERLADRIILAVFALLLLWCAISVAVYCRWTAHELPYHWYMRPEHPAPDADPNALALTGAINFFVGLLLYSYLVPISLYVSIEMVKVFQAGVLIATDRDMYHEPTDTPALARTSNLNEELGMVSTVLTDKTGTLTRNVMEFFKCSIGGVAYGAGVTEIERTNMMRNGTLPVGGMPEDDPRAAQYRERYFNFYDERLMGDAWLSAPDSRTIEMFFRLLAVCHTVIPDGPTEPESIKYEAESPDEAALVVAAKVFGFFFHRRSASSICVRERCRSGLAECEYEVLHVLEFNSTRKRMSVVIRDKQADKLIIFTKGADTVIYERLDPDYLPNEQLKEATSKHMEEFGAAGLRTLCLSYTEVDRTWYSSVWLPAWTAAKTSLAGREEKLAAAAAKIEVRLRLLGCTAIEDKLQEGVPECIRQLAFAGIRIWVLTGDKMETAINIGFACSLLREDMVQHTVTASFPRVDELERAGNKDAAESEAADLVAKQLDRIESQLVAAGAIANPSAPVTTNTIAAAAAAPAVPAVLIIDGKALSYALAPRLAPALLRVGLRCQAVVCCRVSPLQKAQVTGLVRETGGVTLAIGDGANDVGMIQRAHIGVGISGQEGMQAVMSSDFAIAQFRFLVPLLLVHGQYSYRRITRMILYFLYKNYVFAITLFAYGAFAVFSGSYIYNDTSMTLFNVIFTSAPPLIVGMFDRPLGKQQLLLYPQLYSVGVANRGFGLRAILTWAMVAVLQAILIMGLVLRGASPTTASGEQGMPYDMPQMGVLLFTVVLLTVNLQLVALEEAFTWLHGGAIGGSIALWYVYLLAFGALPVAWSLESWHLFDDVVAQCPHYWLYSIIVPVMAVLPVWAFRMIRSYVAPTDEEIIAEIARKERREVAGGDCSQQHPSPSPNEALANSEQQQEQHQRLMQNTSRQCPETRQQQKQQQHPTEKKLELNSQEQQRLSQTTSQSQLASQPTVPTPISCTTVPELSTRVSHSEAAAGVGLPGGSSTPTGACSGSPSLSGQRPTGNKVAPEPQPVAGVRTGSEHTVLISTGTIGFSIGSHFNGGTNATASAAIDSSGGSRSAVPPIDRLVSVVSADSRIGVDVDQEDAPVPTTLSWKHSTHLALPLRVSEVPVRASGALPRTISGNHGGAVLVTSASWKANVGNGTSPSPRSTRLDGGSGGQSPRHTSAGQVTGVSGDGAVGAIPAGALPLARHQGPTSRPAANSVSPTAHPLAIYAEAALAESSIAGGGLTLHTTTGGTPGQSILLAGVNPSRDSGQMMSLGSMKRSVNGRGLAPTASIARGRPVLPTPLQLHPSLAATAVDVRSLPGMSGSQPLFPGRIRPSSVVSDLPQHSWRNSSATIIGHTSYIPLHAHLPALANLDEDDVPSPAAIDEISSPTRGSPPTLSSKTTAPNSSVLPLRRGSDGRFTIYNADLMLSRQVSSNVDAYGYQTDTLTEPPLEGTKSADSSKAVAAKVHRPRYVYRGSLLRIDDVS